MATVRACFVGLSALVQEELRQAKVSIRVAVAWFTDQSIYHVLLQKAKENVKVTVVIRHDAINFNALDNKRIEWQELLEAGGELYCSPDTPALHHKFCVIDESRILSGSYNWTYAARRNHENIMVCDEPEAVKAFLKAHGSLLTMSQAVVNVPALVSNAQPPQGADVFEEAIQEVRLREDEDANDEQGAVYEKLVLEADAAYAQKKYKEAEKLANQALILKPDRIGGYYVLASVYSRIDRQEMCVTIAHEAEAKVKNAFPPQWADLWNIAGNALTDLERYSEAVAYFNRSIREEPNRPLWYRNKYLTMKAWRPNEAKKVASDGRQVASREIKACKGAIVNSRLVQAYIVQASLREHFDNQQNDAREAQKLYECLPPEERDLHDRDDINYLMRHRL